MSQEQLSTDRNTANDSNNEEDKSYAQQLMIMFKLGDGEYALNIDQIKEVVAQPATSFVPLCADYIVGVANVRGDIIAIINLEERFGLPSTIDESSQNYVLVVDSPEYKMGILVNEVPNTLAVSEKNIDTSISAIGETNDVEQNYIKGIIKMNDRLVVQLDVFKVISENEVKKALL